MLKIFINFCSVRHAGTLGRRLAIDKLTTLVRGKLSITDDDDGYVLFRVVRDGLFDGVIICGLF